MDKIKYVKLENEDGSYGDSIPLAVDGKYVDINGNNLVNELNSKATKAEVQSLASGSPAGVYATVVALTTADPNHSKVYLVTADGHWYYYNSGWQDGGIYQGTEDAEVIDARIGYDNYPYTTLKDSIQNQIKDIHNEIDTYMEAQTSLNLFDPLDRNVVLGYAVDYNTGLPVVNSSYNLTGYISVNENSEYTITSTGSVAFYDENYDFVSGAQYTIGKHFNTPLNSSFMRVSVLKTAWDSFMCVKGYYDTDNAPRVPYNRTKNLKNVAINGNVINKNSLNIDTLTTYQKIYDVNLFNKNDEDVMEGYAVRSTDGVLIQSNSYNVSGFIPVEAGKTYTMTTNTNRAFYNINKEYVAGAPYSDGKTLVAPEYAAYIRCSIQDMDTYMLVEGDTLPSSYAPYVAGDSLDNFYINSDHVLNPEVFKPHNVLKDKKIGFLGDSYTAGSNKYHTFIAERTGMIAYNYGASGSRICKIGTNVQQGETFYVDSFITRCEDMDDDLDMVFVFGGINDAGSSSQEVGTIDDPEAENSTFYAGYKLLLHKLVEKYPTAIIGCVVPPQVRNYTRLHTTFKQAILDVCNMYGVPVLDLDGTFSYSSVDITKYELERYSSNNAGSSSVDIHLNRAGQAKMSVLIQKFLESQFVE